MRGERGQLDQASGKCHDTVPVLAQSPCTRRTERPAKLGSNVWRSGGRFAPYDSGSQPHHGRRFLEALSTMNTGEALEAITDAGLFELLATAVLREAEPHCDSLVQTGVNAAGKTVSAPLDGIGFVPGADPPHMIAVHHTTTERRELRAKWLNEPRERKGPHGSPKVGDLIKTGDCVVRAREEFPDLRATLILTTNREPDDQLVTDVNLVGNRWGLEVRLWHRSRISHFLDSPAGQWVRRQFLGVEQELLSSDLFHELSRRSLESQVPPGDPETWVDRALDRELQSITRNGVTFLVADSGLGKSVACYRALAAHVEAGGFGLVLRHENVVNASSVDRAIASTLNELHPRGLVTEVPSSYGSVAKPLLLVVEDLNRSGQPQRLAQKLASWSQAQTPGGSNGGQAPRLWRLLCPLWPTTIASMDHAAKELIAPLVRAASSFTESEARDAVLSRALSEGQSVSDLEATEIGQALGRDPLLVALCDLGSSMAPQRVIGDYVESCLSRVAAAHADHMASDYVGALRALAAEMLDRGDFSPLWTEIREWQGLQEQDRRLLAQIAHLREPIYSEGSPNNERVAFRHDRVRDWLLADAVLELDRRHALDDAVLAEPYYAEVLGQALVRCDDEGGFLQRLAKHNPLALFHGLRLFGPDVTTARDRVLSAVHEWLNRPESHDRSRRQLRWEALAMLAETDSAAVPSIVCQFQDPATNGQLARLRNGDLGGGVELCADVHPGATAPWRDAQIEHARLRHGKRLTQRLDCFLRSGGLTARSRTGALRLAGHLADPALAPAIVACWASDSERSSRLGDYLWASARCCGEKPVRYLRPVCDAWAQLSDEPPKPGYPSPRDDLAANEVRWAFRRWPPENALGYFADRATNAELSWPITYMLHGIDHPLAVTAVARDFGKRIRDVAQSGGWTFLHTEIVQEWRRPTDGTERTMSKASRSALHDLWRDETHDRYLRSTAFRLWSVTRAQEDIEVLRGARHCEDLVSLILRERLLRGDTDAVPTVLEKLSADEGWQWWQYVQRVWCPALTEALDSALTRRGLRTSAVWGEGQDSDWLLYHVVVNLPSEEGERLLLAHWSHLRYTERFIGAALRIATPRLLEAVGAALRDCPRPKMLLEHFELDSRHILWEGGGVVREEQVRGVLPHVELLSPFSTSRLWEECNRRGWFDIRREHLDGLIREPFPRGWWDREEVESELERICASDGRGWFGFTIDAAIAADVSWSEILSTVLDWFRSRRSIEAFEVVAAAIRERGSRRDLDRLAEVASLLGSVASGVVEDARFAVCRRTLADDRTA